METILISLKESAYKDFINGIKKFEYRKKWINEKTIAYIYVTGEVKSIKLRVEFDKPIYKPKKQIAEIAKGEHDSWYEGTMEYFKNKNYGYAIKALKINELKLSKTLDDMRGQKITPPQNYHFLSNDQVDWIENKK